MITLSCGFPPSRDLPTYARLAESLGYERVWAYDSPALYGDVWVALARVAEATDRIGVGTAVAVPSLRHPVVTASAIATVEDLAPGRLAVAFGTGFTARLAMGKRAMRWAELSAYVTQVRTLLGGDVVEVDGAECQLLASPGFGPPRPIDVPLLVAPAGPKGFAVAHDVADGVVLVGLLPEGEDDPRWETRAVLVNGTVLDPGEDDTSERVRAAAGPWFVTAYHAMYEWAPDALAGMPGGPEWRASIEAERPAGQRHLAVHEGHVVAVTERDRALLDAAGAGLLDTGWTGDRASARSRLEHAESRGLTEVIYTPAGPDVARELTAFASAAQGAAKVSPIAPRYGPLRVNVDHGVAVVTIDHPPTNLVDGNFIGGLVGLLDAALVAESAALARLLASGAHREPMTRFLAEGGQTRDGETGHWPAIVGRLLDE